jgi:hypothetical protein
MTLKLVKYHPLFAYSVGDEFQVNEKDTQHLLDGGYAVPVGKQEIETPEASIPALENASIEVKKSKSKKEK